MNTKIKTVSVAIVLSLFVLSACSAKISQSMPATNTPNTAKIANPASEYCKQKGGKLDIRTTADDNQSGVCVFPDGSECDEWAFYRRECASGLEMPSTQTAKKDETQNNAVEIVRDQVASQLNVEASNLGLVSVEPIDWPDACLGILHEGDICAQVITPGFRITFSSAGQNYTYHTDLSASMIRQETS